MAAGLYLGEDVPKPRMIAARDAVSRAHRAQDPARGESGERHGRHRDAIFGHDHQHAARRQVVDHPLRRAAHVARKVAEALAFHSPPASRSASAGASPFFSAMAKNARARLPSIGS